MKAPPADPKVALYGALNLQIRRLLRGPDAARRLGALLDLAERLDAGHASHRPRQHLLDEQITDV